MMLRSCLILLLVAFGAANNAADRDQKNRPVTKVVTLLKDMVAQLQKEADEDQEVYETMGCWCETNDREKTKAIADANSKIGQLNAEIEKTAGLSAELSDSIMNLQKEVAHNQEELDTATALRQKQLAEFTEEEKDMLGSIGSLGSAVTVLSKHQGAAFLQVPDNEQLDITATIRHEFRKHKAMLAEFITPRQRRAVAAFLQQDGLSLDPKGSASFAQMDSPHAEYAPQSGQIFGVLTSMKETFETNLAKSQEEEASNQHSYEDLKAAKEEEIKAGQDQTAEKTALRADTDEKHAQAKEDLRNTEDTLAADTEFLASLKEHCANIDQEYEERVKTRQLEIGAVSKALAFLTSEESMDLVSRTLGLAQQKPAFIQTQKDQVSHVVKLLQKAAKASHNPRLSNLALKLRIDAFGKVKETLQNMIDQLLKEKEEEIQHKDYCVDSLNTNMKNLDIKERERADAEAKAADHANAMEMLTKAIAADKAQILELRTQLKRAGEERNAANTDFQSTVADQRATQKLLSAALGVLKGFYEKAALVQKGASSAPAGPPPPPGFKKYANNAASGGVMNMIQSIIDDAKAMEAEALSSEEASQQAYEDFTKETNNAVIELQKDIATKTEEHARQEQGKVAEETTEAEKEGDIEQLKKEEIDLHTECDYMLKNFDLRLEARDAEVQALKEGLATFGGATFSALLQR